MKTDILAMAVFRAMVLGAFTGSLVAASILGVFKFFGAKGGRANNIGPILIAVFVFETLAVGVIGQVFSDDSVYFYVFTFAIFLGLALHLARKRFAWVKELADERLLEQCSVLAFFGAIALAATFIYFYLAK